MCAPRSRMRMQPELSNGTFYRCHQNTLTFNNLVVIVAKHVPQARIAAYVPHTKIVCHLAQTLAAHRES